VYHGHQRRWWSLARVEGEIADDQIVIPNIKARGREFESCACSALNCLIRSRRC